MGMMARTKPSSIYPQLRLHHFCMNAALSKGTFRLPRRNRPGTSDKRAPWIFRLLPSSRSRHEVFEFQLSLGRKDGDDEVADDHTMVPPPLPVLGGGLPGHIMFME